MKLRPVIISILTIPLCGCSSHHKVAGWYPIASDTENTIIGESLVTIKDFEKVVLTTDTFTIDGKTVCQTLIQGKIKADRINDFADATEMMIGQRLGFVFNDSVIMTPQVNARIESGSFQIISPDTTLLRNIYNSINQEIKNN